jgi:predicted nucleic acid-binding protein
MESHNQIVLAPSGTGSVVSVCVYKGAVVLIVHAARRSGATVLYTEDLKPGPMEGGIRVVNPFVSQK